MFENHEKIEFNTRKEIIIYYLQFFNKRGKPIGFSDIVFTMLPSGGLAEFESLMEEMVNNNWIIKKSEPIGPVQGMPHLTRMSVTYTISVQGVEYLHELGLIEDKYKTEKKTDNQSIQNYGSIIIGKDVQGVVQGLDFENSRDNTISVNLNPKDQANEPKKAPQNTSEENKDTIWKKIYKWTDHKLISMIIYAILGFIIALILKHFNLL